MTTARVHVCGRGRRRAGRALLAVLLATTASAAPNIIFALGDDTGWHGVGWHQSPSCRPDMAAQLQGKYYVWDTFGIRLGQKKFSHCRLPS